MAEARHTGNYAWVGAARDDRLVRSVADALVRFVVKHHAP
jgi:hypothetical protein